MFYPHGAPSLANTLNWTALIGKQERSLPGVPAPGQHARMNRAARRVPLQAADVEVAGAPVAFWRDFVQHGAPGDDFWAAIDHDGADLTRLPPVSMVTGWWDLFLPGQLRDFAAIRAAGVPARIVVGPWLHGEPAELKEITRQDIAWLDHHLRGGPEPSGAPVRLFLQQAGTWLEFPQWPPPGAASTPFYLRAGGGLSRDAGARRRRAEHVRLRPRRPDAVRRRPAARSHPASRPTTPGSRPGLTCSPSPASR